MGIIFFGTSDFAVSALKKLCISAHKILAVVTAVDKKKGRGQKLSFSAVKIFALNKNLTLWQPKDLQDKRFLQLLKKEPADLFVVCDYGKILTKEVLQIPKIFAINLHASLLPKYRGAAPINWAIIEGERETGITVFKMNEYMDRGEIILQKKTAVSFVDTAVSLSEKLAAVAAQALIEALDLIERKRLTLTAQDQTQASSAPKLKKEDGLINWEVSAIDIHNRIRGLQPWPGAFTYLGNKLLKIWQSQVIEGKKEAEPGKIVQADAESGILVQAGKDRLLIIELQLEGKKKMSSSEFILGHRIKAGEKLGK